MPRTSLLRRHARRLVLCLVTLAAAGPARATGDTELLVSCRRVMAEAEPARRVWLQRDLFAYELQRALGASGETLRPYRNNLAETCARVAHNNAVYRRAQALRVSRAAQAAP